MEIACRNCGTRFDAQRSACSSCGSPALVELICGHCGHGLVATNSGLITCQNDSCKFAAGVTACEHCGTDYWDGSAACPFCRSLNATNFVSCSACGYYFSKFVPTCPNCQARRTPTDKAAASEPPREMSSPYCPKCNFAISPNVDRCPRCGVFLENRFIEGFVYILVHPRIPGLVKIGKTRRPTEQRVAELSQQTGVPGTFILAFELAVSDCDTVELLVHERLKDRRVEGKEFFSLSPQEAADALMDCAKLYRIADDHIRCGVGAQENRPGCS